MYLSIVLMYWVSVGVAALEYPAPSPTTTECGRSRGAGGRAVCGLRRLEIASRVASEEERGNKNARASKPGGAGAL